MTPQDLIAAFDTLVEAPDGVARLRELVLQLAVRGKLVPQDPNDEPANALLERIAEEKARVISSGEAPKPRRGVQLPTEPQRVFDVPGGWAWSLLEDLAVYIQRGKSPKYDDTSSVKVVSQKCVQWAGFDISRARGIRRDSLDKYGPERFLRTGDLLWNSTGTGTVGRINVYPDSPGETIIVADSHVTVIRSAFVDPQYLYCWLAGPNIQGTIEDLTTGTTKQQELGTGTIRGRSVPVPPLAEQHRIVARVDELMGLLDRLEAARNTREDTRAALRDAALAALQDDDTPEEVEVAWERIAGRLDDLFTDPADVDPLRQAVLQLAVRGRLVPQDPEDEPASVPLEQIAGEKARLVNEKKIRKQKPLPPVSEDEVPFEVPEGWEWARPDDLTSVDAHALSIGPFGSNLLKSDYRDIGVPLVFVREIRAETFGDERTKFVTPEKAAQLLAHQVLPGDLLITKMGAPPGDTAIYPSSRPPAIITADCIRFAVHAGVGVVDWFKFAYRAPMIRESLAEITMGIAHQKMSLKRFRATPVPVPPLAEQHRIVAKVDELMRMLDQMEQHLSARTTAHDAFAAAAVHHLNA